MKTRTGHKAERERELKTVAGERSQILARKHTGKRVSPSEQEKLEALTARLKELLPPASVADLAELLAMVEETECIRKRSQERRQRLS